MPHLDPTLSIAERVDATCDRFEQEWRAGRRPRVEDYVAAALESDREELRRQLLALEQELQAQGAADTSISRSSVREEPVTPPNRTVDYVEAGDLSRQTIGRFQVHGKLGHGAFGQVYRAFDPQLGREVAIKVPLETAVATPTDREKFLKEARAAATINHPNVCQIHEVGEHDGRPYIVMALVNGQSLADHLKSRQEPISEKQAALIVRKVALALAAAHDKGIIHRDLKPANIMFDRERKDVIVMDFGLARGPRMGDARGTQSGVIMGTPAYMSPEQASGGSKDVGPAGDVYSLGVVLYELLTGTRPFAGTATEVIGQILHVEPEKPSQRRTGIDPRLESICLKAMAKRPEERFASMREFAAAIDAVLRMPKPTSGSAETMQPVATRREGAEATSSENMADLFAVMSMERKATRAETAAAVEAAMAKHRTPRWVFVAIGLAILFGFIALGGIIFYARTPTATVMIHIDVDLNDKTLSFFLDGKQVPAESLQTPIELKVGTHELIVKRGEEVIRKFTFIVSRDAGPRIELREETPPKKEYAATKPVWKPLIKSADELIEEVTRSRNTETCSVRFENETMTLTGAGAKFFPKFTAKNFVVRAQVLSVRESLVFTVRRTTGGSAGFHGVFHNVELGRDWSTCGIGEGDNIVWWGGLAGSWQRVVDQFPAELAVSVFEDQIALYVNGEKVCEAKTTSVSPGGITIGSKLNYAASLRDLSVCVLDGTRFTPDDVYPQRIDDETKRLLSPEFLTAELKKNNLLLNPGFEEGEQNWRSHSGGKKRTSVVNSPVRSGKHALRISSDWWDAARAIQTVAVKPNRRYLFSGWIKTESIRFYERDKSGAHLFVPGGYRHRSVNVPVTADWTYYAVVIHSGDRTEIKVQPALGHFGGTVMGTAWFDDLCLIELPDQMAPHDDLTRWQGTWRCVAEHSRGKRLTDEELKQRGTIMRIEGNRREVERTLDGRFSRYGGTFQLHSAKSPKEFDYDDEQGQGPRNYHRGVYEFDGERLRLIYRHAQGSVPQRAGWKDIGQPNVVWFEFEKSKPDPDRAAAIKVLQLRGILTVQVGDKEIGVNGRDQHEPFDQLPQEPFQITQIDLRNDRRRVLPTDSLEPLAGLKSLKRLTLEGAEIGGNGIRPLAGLTTLEFLVLDSCRLSDADLVHLKDLANLTELSLSWNQLTGTGFVHLKGLTKLKLLSLYATQTTDDNLAHLYGLPELERLVVHQCQVTGKTFPNFKTWPRWKSVYLRGGPPSSRDLLPHLKTNQALEELALNMAWTDDDLAHLATNKALQVLEIDQGAAITDRGLAYLSGLTNMRRVLLKDSQITDEGLDHLLGWKSLGMIHLPPKITHRGVAKLRALPNLSVLGWRSATDEGMVYMKDFPNLKELWLNNSKVTDVGLKHLHRLPNLGEIGLRNTAVTTAGIQALKESYQGRPFQVFLGD